MRLELVRIELERFKSFRQPCSIDLQGDPGLHFLRGRNEAEPRLGPNGAGKSSIWDALAWAWYGETPDGLKGPDLIPWGGEGGAMARVTSLHDGKRHIVERTASPNSLLLDGVAVGQEQVQEALGLSPAAFLATLLLGQGQPLFLDLPPRSKMELFSSVLDLDRWEVRSKAAGERAGSLQRDLDEIGGEQRGLKDELDRLLKVIDRTEQLSEDWEAENEKRLASLGQDEGKLVKQMAIASKAKDEADVALDMADTEFRGLRRKIDEVNEERQKVRGRLLEIDANVVAADRLVEGLERARRSREGPCPTCGQKLPKNPRHLDDELREARAEVRRLQDSCVPITASLRQIDKDLKALADSKAKFAKKADEAEAVLRLQVPAVAELAAKIAAIKRACEERQEQDNPHRVQLKELKRTADQLGKKGRDLEDEASRIGARMERYRYWVKGFKTVRLYEIEEVLQELELATNAVLEEVGLIGWSIQYSVEKETKTGGTQRGLHVAVLSPRNGKPVKWECWSGGEGQRLRLIGTLALSDVLLAHAGVDASFEILDEPTRGLSAEGVRDLCDYLAQRADALGRRIWFTDHLAVESSRFASVLTVCKGGAGSYVEGMDVGRSPPQPKQGSRERLRR